eukprot:350184-Chlamydomonas_euryale.AAC.3
MWLLRDTAWGHCVQRIALRWRLAREVLGSKSITRTILAALNLDERAGSQGYVLYGKCRCKCGCGCQR